MAGRQALLLGLTPTLEAVTAGAIREAGFEVASLSAEPLLDAADHEREERLAGLIPGEIDVLVTGDALFPVGPDPDTSLRSGFQACFLSVRIVLRGMVRHRFGRIVLLAPPADRPHLPHRALRGGLAGFTKSIAREVGSRGIAANLIVLGTTVGEADGEIDSVTQKLIHPSDVGSVVAFLVAQAPAHFTGQVLRVDANPQSI